MFKENICRFTFIFAIILMFIGDILMANSVKDNIDSNIELVENELDEVQAMLNKIRHDPQQLKQFTILSKHVNLIRDQLRVIQEEYHMNKELDQFADKFGMGNGNVDIDNSIVS